LDPEPIPSSANLETPELKVDIVWEMLTKMFGDANHTNDKPVKQIRAYEN
jgi:hypothetical protein